jgi:hypothetical protein
MPFVADEACKAIRGDGTDVVLGAELLCFAHARDEDRTGDREPEEKGKLHRVESIGEVCDRGHVL